MFGTRNVEDEIKKQQEERKQLQNKGVAFGVIQEEEETVAPAPLPNEFNKTVAQSYSNPKKFLEETASLLQNDNPFEKYSSKKKISEREGEYRSRWRKRALSPDRYGENNRSYKEIVMSTQIEREKQDLLMREAKRKKMEEASTVQNTSISLQPSSILYSNQSKWKTPMDAQLPIEKWRLYVFKNEEFADPNNPFIPIHTKKSILFGRDRSVVDVPLDHLSCSKEHAAICFKQKKDFIVPYLIDLKSANGTLLNGKQIDSERFYELKEKDIIQFGQSSREYIVLKEEGEST